MAQSKLAADAGLIEVAAEIGHVAAVKLNEEV
jgi:hypothetical protein